VDTAHGLRRANGVVISTNNYVGDVISDGGAENCYQGTQTSTTNVASDTSGDIDNQSTYTSYFINTTVGSEDFHLKNSSNALWGSDGTDLDGDSNLPITDDIDGDVRHSTTPDIGADEWDNVIVGGGGPLKGAVIIVD
jgi:hypothetical protein